MAYVVAPASPNSLDTMKAAALKMKAYNKTLRTESVIYDVFEKLAGEIRTDPKGMMVPDAIFLKTDTPPKGARVICRLRKWTIRSWLPHRTPAARSCPRRNAQCRRRQGCWASGRPRCVRSSQGARFPWCWWTASACCWRPTWRRSSGASSVSLFGVILPTRISPGFTSAPIRTTPS